MFSTSGPLWDAAAGELKTALNTRNSMAFRPGKTPLSAGIFGHPETEDRKLRKDPSWRSLL
jgi:hypothetical protein